MSVVLYVGNRYRSVFRTLLQLRIVVFDTVSELRDSILDIGASVSVCLLSESRKLDLCLDIHRARAQAENVDVVVTQPNYTEKLGRSYVKCRMRVVRTRDGDGPVKNTFYCPKARVMTTIPVDLPAVYVSSSDIDNSVLLCDSNMRLIHFIRNLNFIIESKTEIEKKND